MSGFPRSTAALAALAILTSSSRAQSLDLVQYGLAMDDVAISPSGHMAVVRENNNTHFTRLYDLQAGTLVALVPNSTPLGNLMGECQNGVALTDTRAVVLGTEAQVLDLTTPSTPLLASIACGYRPRDVAITPDGTIACVRGGSTLGGYQGGQYLIDLAAGTLLAFGPGEPVPYPYTGTFSTTESFDVDSVVASNRYALFTSYLAGAPGKTRVTIWDLHPPGGGAPVVAFETTPCAGCGDLPGAGYDVAISPDGNHAAVRSERAVALFDLSGAVPSMLWQHRPWHNNTYYFMTAQDALEMTNDRVVVLSRWGGGTQVDLYDAAGDTAHYRGPGDPHDLALTPDGTRALVRNNLGVFLFEITQIPADEQLHALARGKAPSSATSYFGGIDTIACDNRFAVSLAKSPTFTDTIASFWRIDRGTLELYSQRVIAGSRPLDIALVPGGSRVVISGNANISVLHLATGDQLYSHNPVPPNTWYPWCNGCAASAEHAVGVSMNGDQQGWVELVDLAPLYAAYCIAGTNSTGEAAKIGIGGRTSVAAHDLHLLADRMPPGALGRFVMGTAQAQLPFGAGFSCVGGSVTRFPLDTVNLAGAAARTVPSDPGIVAGATRYFQFVYRDPQAGGIANATEGASVSFTP